MIEFLISALVLVVVIYVVKIIIDMIPLPAPAKTIVYIILGLFVLLAVLQWLGLYDAGLKRFQ